MAFHNSHADNTEYPNLMKYVSHQANIIAEICEVGDKAIDKAIVSDFIELVCHVEKETSDGDYKLC